MREYTRGPRRTGLATFLLCLVPVAEGGAAQAPAESRVIATDVANLRADPSVASAVVRRVEIGTRLRVLSRSSEEEEIGGNRAHWYEVIEQGEAARGWVFGALTLPFDPDRPEVAFDTLVERFADRRQPAPFLTLDALERALDRMQNEYGESPDLEILRLDVLDAAGFHVFGWTPGDPAHATWVEKHRDLIRYYETGGYWEVRREAFWDLVEKYRSRPEAERIAWHASQPPSSHCEDDAGCWLSVGWESLGEYLKRFPGGLYVDSALHRLRRHSEIAAEYACWDESTGEPRVDAALLSQVREILGPIRSSAKHGVLEDLDRVDEKCG